MSKGPNGMADALKPQHYILRSNGAAVPLIAVDELPHNIRIEGISRTLNFKDVASMKCVGEVETRHDTYRVHDINKAPSHFLAADDQFPKIPSSASSTVSIVSRSARDNIFLGPKKYYGIEEQAPDPQPQNISNFSDATSEGLAPTRKYDPLPSWKDVTALGPRLPARGKKVYCSHWMSTGECDYAQQGCLYKHEMPLDRTLLNALGYQDIPKWYREKHGLGRLTAVQGSDAHIRAFPQPQMMQKNWRSSSGPNSSSRLPGRKEAFRSSAHASKASESGQCNARPQKVKHSQARRQSNLLDFDEPCPAPASRSSAVKTPSPHATSGSGLLNSKYAVMSPVVRAKASTRLYTDATSSRTVCSHTAALAEHVADATGGRLASDEHSTCRNEDKPSHEGEFSSQEAHHSLAHGSNGFHGLRRSSLASDHEAELALELHARDLREEESYALAQARYNSQREHTNPSTVHAEAGVDDRGSSVSEVAT